MQLSSNEISGQIASKQVEVTVNGNDHQRSRVAEPLAGRRNIGYLFRAEPSSKLKAPLDSSANTSSMALEALASALRTIGFPRSQQDRFTLALGTAAVLGSAFLLPAAYRDYRTFKSYGPGGIPNNLLGWLTVRTLFQPFGREMLSTEVYLRRIDAAEGHGKGDDGYLTLSEEQLHAREKDGRPVVGPHVVPQRQITQIPDEDIMEKLCTSFRAFGMRNYHLVKFERSNLEMHADGLFLADHLPITDIAETMKGEVAHLHTGYDHSIHCILSPADCLKIIEAGWGQRHAFSGTSALTFLSLGTLPDLPAEYVMIYAPRDEAEIEIVMGIVSASVKFMTGREDVR
ncbi:hypothetical protein N7462_011216 [Penicillium macrosclerotiorum]|uniref:uncharacterized protein n=1 Tax=Penicillium macrosclerotiorum TaxID=303699 RepID=UPI002548B53D|nr:uncharacterized protein N7462_011216 [Penicillium macrosclerotiorum]KAJ5666807.1 hypothetical protein N7462_011216 [Penicillium macrosclerotiorum]